MNQAQSVGSYRTRPVCPPQHRVVVPKHQQLSVLRQVAAENQDG
jgi:hypothetical protein